MPRKSTTNQPPTTAFYQSYLPFYQIQEGLETGDFIKGTLRINQRNYEEAYISNPDGDEYQDIMIIGLRDRNRALNDDVVVIQLRDRNEWVVRDPAVKPAIPDLTRLSLSGNEAGSQKTLNYRTVAEVLEANEEIPSKLLQKTAKVVHIAHQRGVRVMVGKLKMTGTNPNNWVLFAPLDSRAPRMLIPGNQMPMNFFTRPQDFEKFLFVASIFRWEEKSKMAHGKLINCLGDVGDLKTETQAILITNGIDTREFAPEVLKSLPYKKNKPWKIDEKEFEYRRDFRDYTICTIDPLTARDLDDALHIKHISDCDDKGNPGWEVGVHIADVSFFLKPNSKADEWARKRSTSFYLVDQVIPMLPRVLCEDLCSLNPGVDRLAFSIVWKMNENAEIKSQWIGRSIIRSCTQFAYEHAQEIIVNPDKKFKKYELPEIFNGKSIEDVKESVINLNKIGVILRKRRMEDGSLALNVPKLRFVLSPDSGLPLAVGVNNLKEANFLVEELMLLANMSVAKSIYDKYPETALLRRHPSPKKKLIADALEKLQAFGYSMDFSSSKSVAQSLNKYHESEEFGPFMYPALVQFVLRSMQLALYFSSGACNDFHHYALNVPFYTHFTSPIRRYPDVVVHRLLAASLGYSAFPSIDSQELERLCLHCNSQKVKAKTISDASDEIFFSLFIREIGQLRTIGVIVNIVLDSAIDVLLVKYNVVKRVYFQKMKLTRPPQLIGESSSTIVLEWNADHVSETNLQRFKDFESKPQTTTTTLDDDSNGSNVVEDAVSSSDKLVSGTSNESATKQTLHFFSSLRILLTSAEEALEFICSVEPTPDSLPLKSEEINNILGN